MNIDDIKKEEITVPTINHMVVLFDHQYAAQLKYEAIERRNGFWHPGKMRPAIDDPQLQHWLKDMFWRTTEELAEASEVTMSVGPEWKKDWDLSPDVRHFFEELADAMHFLINASIYAGLQPASIDNMWRTFPVRQAAEWDDSCFPANVLNVVMRLGLSANCLKNKPWKETQMPTDAHAFRIKLLEAWQIFVKMWSDLGCNVGEVYLLYMRKYTVNTFRRETRY